MYTRASLTDNLARIVRFSRVSDVRMYSRVGRVGVGVRVGVGAVEFQLYAPRDKTAVC